MGEIWGGRPGVAGGVVGRWALGGLVALAGLAWVPGGCGDGGAGEPDLDPGEVAPGDGGDDGEPLEDGEIGGDPGADLPDELEPGPDVEVEVGDPGGEGDAGPELPEPRALGTLGADDYLVGATAHWALLERPSREVIAIDLRDGSRRVAITAEERGEPPETGVYMPIMVTRGDLVYWRHLATGVLQAVDLAAGTPPTALFALDAGNFAVDDTHVYYVSLSGLSDSVPIGVVPRPLRRAALDGSSDELLDADARLHHVQLTEAHVVYWTGLRGEQAPVAGFTPLVQRRMPKAGGEAERVVISPYGFECITQTHKSTLYASVNGLQDAEGRFGVGIVSMADDETTPLTTWWSADVGQYPQAAGDEAYVYLNHIEGEENHVIRTRRDGAEPTPLHVLRGTVVDLYVTDSWVLWGQLPADDTGPGYVELMGFPR